MRDADNPACWGILAALVLAGCTGSPFGGAIPAATASGDMTGRWILSEPYAPSCGMNFAGAPGAHDGTVVPEGGCPGKFFTSRHWTLEQSALTIDDDENQPLAHFTSNGDRFEGQAGDGTPVTLAHQSSGPQ